jgi:prepilin-type N-terminal cleavage/methylation domain-containing protein
MTRAFTLVELLVSVAIGLLLTAAAWAGFRHALALAERTEARTELHNSARFLYQALERDLGAAQAHGAAWLITEPAGSQHGGRVRLGFLSAKTDAGDFLPGYDIAERNAGDLVWCTWVWTRPVGGGPGVLAQARSTGIPRSHQMVNGQHTWKPPGLAAIYDLQAWPFVYLPTPRRTLAVVAADQQPSQGRVPGYAVVDAGGQRQRDLSALDDQRWGIPGVGWDHGDATDLERNLTPVVPRIEDLRIQLVLADGSVLDGGPSPAAHLIDGVLMDGGPDVVRRPPLTPGAEQAVTATAPDRRRPALLRLMGQLRHARVDVTYPFSCTLAWPGPLARQP